VERACALCLLFLTPALALPPPPPPLPVASLSQERISFHRKQHEVVLATIPSSVNVGAFAVSLAEVRTFLAKKHTVRPGAALGTDGGADGCVSAGCVFRPVHRWMDGCVVGGGGDGGAFCTSISRGVTEWCFCV
jgi:hypothetical protein